MPRSARRKRCTVVLLAATVGWLAAASVATAGPFVYVTNLFSHGLSQYATGQYPVGVTVSPDGRAVYLAPAPVATAQGPMGHADGLAGATYGGETGQHLPVVLTVSSDGQTVERMATAWTADCDDPRIRFGLFMTLAGGSSPLKPGQHRLTDGVLSPDGTFSASSTGIDRSGPGVTSSISQTVTGRLGATEATGTWQADIEIVDRASGELITECSTGSVRWRAPDPQRLYYAGYTSQQAPVTIHPSAGRRRIAKFHTLAKVSCSDGGVFAAGRPLKAMAIKRGGRFASDFTRRAKNSGGGTILESYTLRGRLVKDRASGTLRYKQVSMNRKGRVTYRCRSPLVRWQADQ